MHADELRQAVTRIVALLQRAEIRAALDGYRAARGDERAVAAARLRATGASIIEAMETLSPAERRVARLMHLEALGTTDYWRSLFDGTADAKAHQAELVRLASRVMFASGQLPAFASMLETVRERVPEPPAASLADGEARLVMRLSDAGEKASDPDRIARSIDGVDMLYSACASIARKSDTELRLERIEGGSGRDLHFAGERESLAAVSAVIESIPAALAEADPAEDIDLEAVVASLPVFEDLARLAALGIFSSADLKDIGETMHQGALLVLESGVTLIETPRGATPGVATNGASKAVSGGAGSGGAVVGGSASATAPASLPRHPFAAPDGDAAKAAGDEHYEHYLREREAMQRTRVNGTGEAAASQRRDAVEELLRSLNQSRNG